MRRSSSWIFNAGDLAQTASIRRELMKLLNDAWGSDDAFRGLLAAHEVIANAAVHGVDTVVVIAYLDDELLCVEVSDCSPKMPSEDRNLDGDAESGRGLAMLRMLGARWHAQLGSGGGKVVSMYLDRRLGTAA